jgi:hypothetical protein
VCVCTNYLLRFNLADATLREGTIYWAKPRGGRPAAYFGPAFREVVDQYKAAAVAQPTAAARGAQ